MTIGTLSLNAGARFIADISGNLPGVGHDQLVVTNSVTLNNPRLILRRSSFVPAPNTNFMVVRNDGADAVTGVFVDSNGRTLPEGTVLTDSFGPGLVPRISYRGGDGNDVVIRVTTPPKVLGLTTTTPDGVLRVGDAITIQVLMSKRVVVEGTPRLRLNVADMRFATYTGGTGTTTLSFSYTIQPGDAAAKLDAFNNLPVRLNGSRIADASGNAAQLTFVAPGMPGTLSASKTILVDGVAPVILGIGSKTRASGTARVGNNIVIELQFSEPVAVTGRPRLAMKLDASKAARYATYSQGSGTNAIQFVYKVQAGDRAARLDYLGASALQLNGGLVRDANGNAAILTLAESGLPGSLADVRNIVVS
jgi:hypothetical protein